jgi:hypothetical protein
VPRNQAPCQHTCNTVTSHEESCDRMMRASTQPPEARPMVDASFALTALERLTAEETAELCDWAAVASARRAISSVW